jgi:glyoxylase-like metal-dependent hydrolase (beta-lactamase superfamily II)
LVEVAGECHAYLQGDGSWGWSNAGLIIGDGASLLVDTLFDLRLTQRMLDAMSPMTAAAPIGQVVNTHANGDHCYGNILVDDAEIIATAATAEEMSEVPASLLAGLNKAPGDVGDLFRSFFGEFEFDGIGCACPTTHFRRATRPDVGGRRVN